VGFLSSFVLDGYTLEDAIWRGQIVARYTCTQKASYSARAYSSTHWPHWNRRASVQQSAYLAAPAHRAH
jgi:hypothetical protein